MSARVLRTSLLLLLPVCAGMVFRALPARAADEAAPPEPPVYHRVRLAHCEIVTTCPLKDLADLVGAPDPIFEAVAGLVVSGGDETSAGDLQAVSSPPLVVRIFKSRDEFQKYAAGDRPAFIDFGGYSTSREIVMWREATLALDYRRLAHEMVHALLARRVPKAPWWVHEGLARDFASFQYRPLNYRYSPFLDSEAALMLDAWRAGKWIPLEKLILLRPEDLYGGDSAEKQAYRRLAYAEAWALVYFIRRDRALKRQGAFAKYLDALRTGGTPLGAFREVFGTDLGVFEKRWLDALGEWQRQHSTP